MTQIHDGHRQRLKQRMMSEGLESFEPHEVLELLLFYAIPQRNVNPLAHQLIERFGSLGAVLGAPKEQLIQVPGVGDGVADWLSSLSSILDRYTSLKLSDRPKLNRLSAVAQYAEQLFRKVEREQLWVLNLNSAGHLLHSQMLAEGAEPIRKLGAKAVMDTTLRYHAQALVVLQRRLPQGMETSEDDVRFTAALNELLTAVGVALMDNIKICGHRRESLRESGVLVLEARDGVLSEESGFDMIDNWLA